MQCLARNPLPEVLCGKAVCKDVKSTHKIKRFGLFQTTLARVPKHDGRMLGCLEQSVVSDREVLYGQFLLTPKQ